MVHTHNWCSSTGEGLGQACAHTVNLVIEMLSPAQKGGCEMCFGIRDGKGTGRDFGRIELWDRDVCSGSPQALMEGSGKIS